MSEPRDRVPRSSDDGLQSTGPGSERAPDDPTLLRRFVDGDRSALGELAARHERDLLGLAQGLVGRVDAPDVVQETWMRVIRGAAGFRGRSAVRTWLWRITVNGCRDLADRRRRRARRELRAATGAVDRGAASLAAGGDVGVADEELVAALGRLDADRRELLILCHHRGGGLAVAAEVLDIPIGTVKSRLYTARRALHDELTKDGGR